MHILVVNDDGPPSKESPYILPFAELLEAKGHRISVAIPHVHCSWIAKAHRPGLIVEVVPYTPTTGIPQAEAGSFNPELVQSCRPRAEWALVTGTPASCVQIGLNHLFNDEEPIDLVVSGPNFGRNTTTLFTLSSGTIGAALEACVCDKRAIAISLVNSAVSKNPEVIAAGLRRSVALVEYLLEHWDADTDFYSVNIPLLPDLETRKVFYSTLLQTTWSSGSLYKEMPGNVDQEHVANNAINSRQADAEKTTRRFAWAQNFRAVYTSAETSPPCADASVVAEGCTR